MKFYCGDAEVVVDEKKEFKMEWIPGAGLAPPNIWVVNVGGVSATDIHGQWFVSERLDQLQWNPGDKKYPRAAGWQINKMHRAGRISVSNSLSRRRSGPACDVVVFDFIEGWSPP